MSKLTAAEIMSMVREIEEGITEAQIMIAQFEAVGLELVKQRSKLLSLLNLQVVVDNTNKPTVELSLTVAL